MRPGAVGAPDPVDAGVVWCDIAFDSIRALRRPERTRSAPCGTPSRRWRGTHPQDDRAPAVALDERPEPAGEREDERRDQVDVELERGCRSARCPTAGAMIATTSCTMSRSSTRAIAPMLTSSGSRPASPRTRQRTPAAQATATCDGGEPVDHAVATSSVGKFTSVLASFPSELDESDQLSRRRDGGDRVAAAVRPVGHVDALPVHQVDAPAARRGRTARTGASPHPRPG